jgi:hypothetical protein
MASGPFLGSGAWVTSVAANDSTQKEELGILRFENGKVFKYVQVSSAANIAANFAAEYTGTSTGVRLAVASAQKIAGIAETALSTSFYGWITVQGLASAMCNSSVTAGNGLIVAGTAGMLTVATSASLARADAIALTTGLGSTAGTTATAIVVSCL